MKQKLTVKEVLSFKGKRKLTQVYVKSPDEAAACEAAGIDMIVAGSSRGSIDQQYVRSIRAAASQTFLTVPISLGAAVSNADAIRFAIENMNLGADAVYTSVSTERVTALAREHIPVVGHVGLVPLRNSWFGGFRAVGKTAKEAIQVYFDTLEYQQAGAIAVEMELVPYRVTDEIAKRTNILIISMGSGGGGDIQYLFACDILGSEHAHIPRHARVYRNHALEYDRLQQDRIAAFQEFRTDVTSGSFPERAHLVAINDHELAGFMDGIRD